MLLDNDPTGGISKAKVYSSQYLKKFTLSGGVKFVIPISEFKSLLAGESGHHYARMRTPDFFYSNIAQ